VKKKRRELLKEEEGGKNLAAVCTRNTIRREVCIFRGEQVGGRTSRR